MRIGKTLGSSHSGDESYDVERMLRQSRSEGTASASDYSSCVVEQVLMSSSERIEKIHVERIRPTESSGRSEGLYKRSLEL